MSLTIGQEATFEFNLTVGGRAISIPTTATVTAQLFALDGSALSGVIPVYSTAIGANWSAGFVVINLLPADTARAVEESVQIVLTVNDNGVTEDWTVSVAVDSPADNITSLFDRGSAINFVRANQLMLCAATYGVLNSVTDDYLWQAIKAAEATVGRLLKVPLVPTEIFTDEPTPAEVIVLNGNPYLVEPGYDMPPDFFSPNVWGTLLLRVTPVIEIKRMDFVYPSHAGSVFTIPLDWIRLDKKYGQLHIFPSAQAITAPLSIFMMQALGSGYNIPNMIRVRYTAGLKNAEDDYPDVINLVQQMAVLSLLRSSMIPQSGSISADGLSQTIALDISKLQDSTNDLINTLQQQLMGPIYAVF